MNAPEDFSELFLQSYSYRRSFMVISQLFYCFIAVFQGFFWEISFDFNCENQIRRKVIV